VRKRTAAAAADEEFSEKQSTNRAHGVLWQLLQERHQVVPVAVARLPALQRLKQLQAKKEQDE
jgi:hypothetical protein